MNLPKKKYVMKCHIGNKKYDNLSEDDEVILDSSAQKQLADELENISEMTYYQRDEEEVVTKNLIRPELAKIIRFLRGE